MVLATVKNVGQRAGDEVVQLYITDMYASVKTRITELKNFTRVHLQPGESKTVSFELTPYELSLLNDRMDRVVEKGDRIPQRDSERPAFRRERLVYVH